MTYLYFRKFKGTDEVEEISRETFVDRFGEAAVEYAEELVNAPRHLFQTDFAYYWATERGLFDGEDDEN